MTHSTYRDIRMTDAYTNHRDTLSYVATDRLPVFADMANTDAKRKAVSDEITARTSMHYADYRQVFSGWTRAELESVRGQYRSDTENLACLDALLSVKRAEFNARH